MTKSDSQIFAVPSLTVQVGGIQVLPCSGIYHRYSANQKIKDESALNNFREYTMLKSKPITEYYGFTEDEVKNLCKQYDMDFDSTKAWYNGYLIDGMHMYNPNSVSMAMDRQDLIRIGKHILLRVNQYVHHHELCRS